MTPDQITAAQTRLAGHVRQTPLLSSPLMNRAYGKRIWVKAECLQITGSFKARGAFSAVSALPPDGRGVIALSSGNHGQGVAWAAALAGRAAVVVMPSDAPAVKIANTRAYGAEVVLYDRAQDDRDAIGADLALQRNLHLIKPFDDPQVIAGQASVGLEIAAQAQDAGIGEAEVLVCCGGGGLSSGIALALAMEGAKMQVRTVEPEGFDDMARSLATGVRQKNGAKDGSICDAILTPAPGDLTLPILARLAGAGIVVTDEQAQRAMAAAFTHFRLVLEPGGAVALAAAMFHDTAAQVICTASGGNVDPALFAQTLALYG